MINKKCLQCNEEFTPNYRLSQKFCNKICQIKFWSLKNKVHLKKYKKEWFLENMNNVLNKAKEYRKRNRDKIREYKKSDRGIFINYVGKFKNSKLSFSDFNKIKERNKYCVYCNNYLKSGHQRVLNSNQIGKILRDEGFIVGNRKIQDISACVILNLKLKYGSETL